ncbi:dihydroorotate dehydrogenase [Clostridium sp. SYSU_GA19001]|uniref:dihydroorotate dehydrogenase n=1 Tax=Clostridium caldaquaticum TaxID=2940653 RepID=UPI002076DAC6|nr:dihydroorotate dehydrogenase [Clostridium caldaquaticum]MCM8710063.1 dihydroorotate dehydrogenase [Clostridium caldaquaticum]
MLNVNFCGIDFKNPVIAASGTFGFGEEFNRLYDVGMLGGISSKGLTLNKREGNSGIRVYETSSGMLNSVGLQNPGIDSFIKNELPKMKKLNTKIIANVGGATLEEYIEAILKLNCSDIDMIELNISCPNVKCGGMAFGIKSSTAFEVVKEIKSVCKKPLMVKLSPNAEDIVDMAYKCTEAGADALSLINTLKGMAIDINKKRAVFDNTFAGLSGPAVKPIALRMVYEVCKAVDIPVVGIGGIMSAEDAIEFIMAGAYAVQIGTANFIKPDIALDIIRGLEKFMEKENIKKLSEIRGII